MVKTVINKGKEVIIMTDDNINSIDNFSNSNAFFNSDLKNLRDNMLIDCNMTIHNDKPTILDLGLYHVLTI